MKTFLYHIFICGAILLYISTNVYADNSDIPNLSELENKAENGNAEAQYELAMMYTFGSLYKKFENYTEAYFSSFYNSVDFFQTKDGQFIKENKEKAPLLFFLAAEQNHIEAKFRLAELYGNNEKGIEILKELANKNHANSLFLLGLAIKKRDIREGIELIKRGAKSGSPEAQYYIGYLYDYGDCIDYILKKNKENAIKFYKMAAAQNHAGAQYALGMLHKSGNISLESNKEALMWFKKACENKHANACREYQMILSLANMANAK